MENGYHLWPVFGYFSSFPEGDSAIFPDPIDFTDDIVYKPHRWCFRPYVVCGQHPEHTYLEEDDCDG